MSTHDTIGILLGDIETSVCGWRLRIERLQEQDEERSTELIALGKSEAVGILHPWLWHNADCPAPDGRTCACGLDVTIAKIDR